MSLKSMSTQALEQRKRACKAFGVDSSAVDQELKSRRSYAIKAGYPAMPVASSGSRTIAQELAAIASERVKVAELERHMPRHTRVVYGAGSTSGSRVAYQVEEP